MLITSILTNKELAQSHYSKIFMELLSNCYDKISEKEANTYNNTVNPEEVSCSSEHIASLLNFIPSNYKEMTSEEQMRPTPHQLVLAQAYQVG